VKTLIARGRRDALALLLLAISALAFFWPLIVQGQWLPQGGGDLVSFLWPQYQFAAESIKSGSLPLWNPHLYSGAPFLADNQAGVLYPINLLAFLVFPQITYQVMEGLVIFHLWLAGACMFAALRLWPTSNSSSIGRGGALLGAVAFMFNDVLITHLGNLNLIAAAAWLPLALALFARGLARRSARATLASAVVFAIGLLAGHAQMTAITLIGLVVVAVWQIVGQAASRQRRMKSQAAGETDDLRLKSKAGSESRLQADSAWRVVRLSGLALIVAFGLSAAQLLPSLEMTRYSLRAGLSYDEATAYSLPPIALASTFSPLLFGRGARDFIGSWPRVETSFVGLIPLLLAGLAFTRKRSNPAWFFAALGLIGLLIALGRYTPIYSLVHALPVLNGLRVPARFILLTNFSLAALAALGYERLALRMNSQRVQRNRLRLAAHRHGVADMGKPVWFIAGAGVIALLLASAVTGQVAVQSNLILALGVLITTLLAGALVFVFRLPPASFILLTALELIALGSTVEIDRNDPTLGYQHQAVIDYLRADGNVFRIENASQAWQPDAALMHGLSDIGGIFNPLGLANYETYRGGMGHRGSALYNFLGAKYVLADKDDPPGAASFVPVFNVDPQIDVYLNTGALPRALLIDEVQIVRSGEGAWAAIHAPEFDPSKSVVVESADDFTLGPAGADKMLAFGAVKADRVELAVTTSAPTMLVLSDVYYPGWIARIDDQPTPIYPANFAFRAVRVPAGSHRVVFEFEPVTWRIGLAITALTVLGLAGAWAGRLGTVLRRRQEHGGGIRAEA
jgi:hypothetical protein